MATLQTDQEIYRGDTLYLYAPYPTITFTTVKSQIRQTEDTTAYYEADAIAQETANSRSLVTFNATTVSLLDATKQYTMDVQYMDAAGVVVTTQKYALSIIKDVTKVFGTVVVITSDYVNEAAFPAIGSAVVGTIYKALDTGVLKVKAHAAATAYTAYF